MGELGLQKVDFYITWWENMVAKHIATQSMMDLCMDSEWRSGAHVYKQWQEQVGIDLVLDQEALNEEEGGEPGKEEGKDTCD